MPLMFDESNNCFLNICRIQRFLNFTGRLDNGSALISPPKEGHCQRYLNGCERPIMSERAPLRGQQTPFSILGERQLPIGNRPRRSRTRIITTALARTSPKPRFRRRSLRLPGLADSWLSIFKER